VRPVSRPEVLLITSEVMRPRFLNKGEFAQVGRNTPLVSIDLIIRNPDRCVLVGPRTNEPAKGKWFVPGGVVRKYERLADAFARIVKAEVGLGASIDDAKFIGVYEYLYEVSFLKVRVRARARKEASIRGL
jgi:colanic acid biosynthesis protein WcaH